MQCYRTTPGSELPQAQNYPSVVICLIFKKNAFSACCMILFSSYICSYFDLFVYCCKNFRVIIILCIPLLAFVAYGTCQVEEVGVTVPRYVTHKHLQPWLIHSFKNLKGRPVHNEDPAPDPVSSPPGKVITSN